MILKLPRQKRTAEVFMIGPISTRSTLCRYKHAACIMRIIVKSVKHGTVVRKETLQKPKIYRESVVDLKAFLHFTKHYTMCLLNSGLSGTHPGQFSSDALPQSRRTLINDVG